MRLKFFRRKNILPIGGAFRRLLRIIPGIHHERAINLNRLVLLLTVEHHSTAEAPSRRLSRLMQNGVRPDRYYLPGILELRFLPSKWKFRDIQQGTPADGYDCRCCQADTE